MRKVVLYPVVFLLLILTVSAITGYVTYTQEKNDFESARQRLPSLYAQYKEIFTTMGWSVSTTELAKYEQQLTSILSSGSNSEQQQNINALYTTWKETYGTYPKTITQGQRFIDQYISEPADIQKITKENTAELYTFQQQFTIKTTLTPYDVTPYVGTPYRLTLVSTTITPNTDTGAVYIYQTIPLSIAASNIIYPKTATIQSNTYQTSYTKLTTPVTIQYAIKNAKISPDQFFDYSTVILPQTPTTVTPAETPYTIGDGICTTPYEDTVTSPEDCAQQPFTIPWLLIIILAIVLLIGLFYFNAYKGRGDIYELTKGTSPFKTSADLAKVKTYIKTSINKGTKKTEIIAALGKENWTRDQVKYAFQEVEWEMRRTLIDSAPEKTVNLEPIILYTKKCLLVNMDPLTIKTKLSAKGWKSEQIEEAFTQAKK